MRNFVFWIAVVMMTAASFASARAEEQKQEAAAAVAAAPAQPAEAKPQPAAPASTAAAPKKEGDSRSAATAVKPAKSKAEQPRQLDPDNPYSPKVTAQALELAKTLNDEQSRKVAELMIGFDLMHKIRAAEDDVGKAVASCGSDNPDLKKKMDVRFEHWKGAVDPLLMQNEKNMNAAIDRKIAGDPKTMRDYFALVQKYEDYEESRTDKHAVTTAGACKALTASMDRTQITLTDNLQKIKWPEAAAAPDKSQKPDQSEPAAGKKP